MQERSAKEYIRLYRKNVGGLAWNWIAENTSSDRAIKITVRYVTGGADPNRWTKTFTLEPGESKHIGRQSDQANPSINASIRGARFIGH